MFPFAFRLMNPGCPAFLIDTKCESCNLFQKLCNPDALKCDHLCCRSIIAEIFFTHIFKRMKKLIPGNASTSLLILLCLMAACKKKDPDPVIEGTMDEEMGPRNSPS